MISVDARKKWFARIEKEPEAGDNLVLTIDEKIQYIAERELEQAIKDTQAIAGTVIVENPHTGEILALANRPTFNPNIKQEIKNEALKNRAVSDIYEPGSTFKLVTIAGAIEEKLTRPNEMFDCQMGSIVINGMRIRDSKPHGVLVRGRRAGGIQRRGLDQDRAAPGRRPVLQIHSRLRLRPADWNRIARRNPRHDEARQSLVQGFDWRHLHGPGDRCLGRPTRGHGFYVRQRRRLGGAAHCRMRPPRRKTLRRPSPSIRNRNGGSSPP